MASSIEARLKALAAAHRAEAAAARKQMAADRGRAEALRQVSQALKAMADVTRPPHSKHFRNEARLAAREAQLFDGMVRLREKEDSRARRESETRLGEAQGFRSSSMMKDSPNARMG